MELLTITRDGKQVAILVLPRSQGVSAAPHTILGEIDLVGHTPDWGSFRRNTPFVEFYTRYMRGELPTKPRILTEARVKPGDNVYVIDPRVPDPQGEVPFHDIVGWYQSGTDGRPRPETFSYNLKHLLVVGDGVFSALALERRLLDAARDYLPA